MSLNRHPLIRALALALAVAAVAAPAASARVISEPSSSLPTSTSQFLAPPAQTTTGVKSSGFDWGDAGVGAGGIVALVVAGLGVRLAIGHRGQRSTAARSTISAT
jgi:hypothetical protein